MKQHPPDSPNGLLGDRMLFQTKPSTDGGLASPGALALKFEAHGLLAGITTTYHTKGEDGYACVKLIVPTEHPMSRMDVPMEP